MKGKVKWKDTEAQTECAEEWTVTVDEKGASLRGEDRREGQGEEQGRKEVRSRGVVTLGGLDSPAGGPKPAQKEPGTGVVVRRLLVVTALCAVWAMVGCATPGVAKPPGSKGSLVLSVRFPWTSSNDWTHGRLLRLGQDGHGLELVDEQGWGGDYECRWSLEPGIYLLEEASNRTGVNARAGIRTGVWIEVVAGKESRADWSAVRIACEGDALPETLRPR